MELAIDVRGTTVLAHVNLPQQLDLTPRDAIDILSPKVCFFIPATHAATITPVSYRQPNLPSTLQRTTARHHQHDRGSKTLQPSYHRNQQYSIIGLTNAAGTLVERYSYTACGTLSIHAANGTVRTTSTYANRYTYTGREYDADLKLYHFRARWYDPATGGFISRDPLGYVDGMSLYRGYFGVRGWDPLGLLIFADDWAWPWDPNASSTPAIGSACWSGIVRTNQFAGQCNTAVWTWEWVEPSLPATSGIDHVCLSGCGLGTGGKAVVNGCGSAVVSTVTLGHCSENLEIIPITKFDKCAGYESAVGCTRFGGEIIVGLTPAGISKIETISRLEKCVRTRALLCESKRVILVADVVANGRSACVAGGDISVNGLTYNNSCQLAFSLAGCTANAVPCFARSRGDVMVCQWPVGTSSKWVQLGSCSPSSYILTGKFQPAWVPGGNRPCAFSAGGDFLIDGSKLCWPPGMEKWKGILGQRVICP